MSVYDGFGLRIGHVPGRKSVALMLASSGEVLAYFRSDAAALTAASLLPVPGMGEPDRRDEDLLAPGDPARFRSWSPAYRAMWARRQASAEPMGTLERRQDYDAKVIFPLLPAWPIMSSFVALDPDADAGSRVEYAFASWLSFNAGARESLLQYVFGSMVDRHGTPDVDDALMRYPGQPGYGEPYDATMAMAFLDQVDKLVPPPADR